MAEVEWKVIVKYSSPLFIHLTTGNQPRTVDRRGVGDIMYLTTGNPPGTVDRRGVDDNMYL